MGISKKFWCGIIRTVQAISSNLFLNLNTKKKHFILFFNSLDLSLFAIQNEGPENNKYAPHTPNNLDAIERKILI